MTTLAATLHSFRTYLGTLNHFHQQNKVWCLLVLDGDMDASEAFWSTGNQAPLTAHAEEHLCLEFPRIYNAYVASHGAPPTVVDIFIRFSPCGTQSTHLHPAGCTPKLLNLVLDYPQVPWWNVYFERIHGNNNHGTVNASVTAMAEASAATNGCLRFYEL